MDNDVASLLGWTFGVLLTIVVTAAIAIGNYTQAGKARREQARNIVEQRAIELLVEFPHLPDETLGQLMRDELINRRLHDPSLFVWATPETVGRIRRSLLVEMHRQQRTFGA
jgi:hypothetical protein